MSQQRRGSDIPIGSGDVSGSGGERRLSLASAASLEKNHHHHRHHSGNVTRGRRSSSDKKLNGYVPSEYEHGLSASRVRKIFPYHVVSYILFIPLCNFSLYALCVCVCVLVYSPWKQKGTHKCKIIFSLFLYP